MNLVAPFGFYGWGNIGDEATLQGFAQLLRLSGTRVNVTIGSRNPDHTLQVEPSFRYFNASTRDPRRWWALLRASAQAVVGGTPIMDIEGDWPLCDLAPLVRNSTDRRKVPMAFVGVGTETLQSDKARRTMSEVIAPRVCHWSVRCDRDRQRLEEYGAPPQSITVAADMAWLIEPVSLDFGRQRLQSWGVDLTRPLIGVNILNERAVLDKNPAMVTALAQALDQLVDQTGGSVVFLSNEVREADNFDKAAALRVMGQMQRASQAVLGANEYFSPPQMMSIIGCCSLTLSMRYHFCMFSALQKVPFIAIERSNKVSDLCWDIDWKARLVPPVLDAMEITAHGSRLLETGSELRRHLEQTIPVMRKRAMLNVAALKALGLG